MTRVHTKEAGLLAINALGYTLDDRVISVLISAEEISVRRIEHVSSGWAVVEDRTIFRPDQNLLHEHATPTGPLETSPKAGQGG